MRSGTMPMGSSNRRASWWRYLAATMGVIAMLAPTAALAAAKYGSRHTSSDSPDFEWHGRIASGKAIEIKGINGGISAEPTTGSEVEVVATMSARHSDPDEVTIEVIE